MKISSIDLRRVARAMLILASEDRDISVKVSYGTLLIYVKNDDRMISLEAGNDIEGNYKGLSIRRLLKKGPTWEPKGELYEIPKYGDVSILSGISFWLETGKDPGAATHQFSPGG